jgi:hypothetical protein
MNKLLEPILEKAHDTTVPLETPEERLEEVNYMANSLVMKRTLQK